MEFRSKEVNAYLKSQNVHHFYALNTETTANYAERLIKTLKHNLFRYMMIKTQRYVDILQDIVHSYNHTIHHSLGATPASITKEKEGESRLQQYLLRRGRTKLFTMPKKKARKKYKTKRDACLMLGAFLIMSIRLCVKAVTEPDSAESTENTERPGLNLRKIANKYDLLLPVSSGTGSICKVC